eukprot:11013459-Prorocentrum_lima.AAC.1
MAMMWRGAPAAEYPQAAGPTSAGLAEPADKRVTVAQGRQHMQTTRKKLSNIMLKLERSALSNPECH